MHTEAAQFDSAMEMSLHRSVTADCRDKLVNDIEQLSYKNDAEHAGVQECCEKLLKKYRTSRAEQLRLSLGKINFAMDENTRAVIECRGATLMTDFAIYVGTWHKSGKRHGQGLIYLADGSIYEGQWVSNVPSGLGRLIFSSCDWYEGQFENGAINGRGRFNRLDMSYYEGEWLNSLPHGNGREEWADRQNYVGSYKYGLKHGLGRFEWEATSYYEGEFSNNCIEGHGVCVWHNGRKYTGHWRANLMHGQGRFETADGRTYDGTYVDGQKQGHGVYTSSNGKRYEGSWSQGLQHGVGVIYESGSSTGRKGLWENGVRQQWVETIN
jgi:hypothetical protein